MRVAYIAIAFFSLVVAANSQQIRGLCPAAVITRPSGVTNPGDTLSFSVSLTPTTADFTYFWSVSRGAIESGQGTAAIIVRTSLADSGQQVVATISVGGLASGCEVRLSESGPVSTFSKDCGLLDEYSNETLSKADQKAWLDNFFTLLANNPADAGWLILRTNPKTDRESIEKRITFILNHVKYRRFDENRLVFAVQVFENSSTISTRVPQGSRVPCDDCRVIYAREF